MFAAQLLPLVSDGCRAAHLVALDCAAVAHLNGSNHVFLGLAPVPLSKCHH